MSTCPNCGTTQPEPKKAEIKLERSELSSALLGLLREEVAKRGGIKTLL